MLKPVCGAGSVPFPPVSLHRQVVCLLLRTVFMCSSQGRAYTVSWLVGVQIKVIATFDLWLFIHASNLLPLNSPPHCPTIIFSIRFLFFVVIVVFLNLILSLPFACSLCKLPKTGHSTFISAQLSSDAVSALRKVRVLI